MDITYDDVFTVIVKNLIFVSIEFKSVQNHKIILYIINDFLVNNLTLFCELKV